MPFLALDGTTVDVAEFTETTPLEIGARRRAFSGKLKSSVRGIKRRWSVTLGPFDETTLAALRTKWDNGRYVLVRGDLTDDDTIACVVRMRDAGYYNFGGVSHLRFATLELTEAFVAIVGNCGAPGSPPGTGVVTADYFDAAHPGTARNSGPGYSMGSYWTNDPANSVGFGAFGGTGEDATTCITFPLGGASFGASGLQDVASSLFTGLVPLTAYTVRARVYADWNGGYATSVFGLRAGGAFASHTTAGSGGGTYPWQGISVSGAMSNALGQLLVTLGWFSVNITAFVVGANLSYDDLEIVYP